MGKERETIDAIVMERQGDLEAKLTNHSQSISTLQREVAVLQARVEGVDARLKERTDAGQYRVALAITIAIAVVGWILAFYTSR